jgi:hypothetical protein
MPQDHGRGRRVDRGAGVGAMLLRAATGVAFVGLVVGLDMSTARAADDDTNASAWSKFMQTLGLKKGPDNSDIDVTERSPLVVPPSRDLPPPVADAAAPAPDWPKDPKVKPHKHHKANVVPAGPNGTTVQTAPPPPYVKKTWYNPATWFNSEEYATFTGEPARDSLTDPPTGYRTPSPDHPYGIGPEKKAKPNTATATPATAAAAPAAAPPATPPGAPQPETPAAAQPATPAATQPESQTGK